VFGLNAREMTKYGTAVATVTGEMKSLGIQSGALSRGIDVLGGVVSGALGPGGIAFVAVGAFATLIGHLVAEQKRLKEETDKATIALIKQAAAQGKGLAGYTAGGPRGLSAIEFEEFSGQYRMEISKIREYKQELEDLDNYINRRSYTGKTRWDRGPWDDKAVDKARSDYIRLRQELDATTEKAEELRQALLSAWYTTSEVSVSGKRPAGGGGGGAGGSGNMYSQHIAAGFADIDSTIRAMGPGVTDQPNITKQISEPFLTANELILEGFESMSVGVQGIYAGMHGTLRGLTLGTSEIVEAALMRENLSRLKGLDVMKFVAGQGAAALLRHMGQVAEKKAIEASAEAFLSIARSTFGPASVGAGFKAAALFGLLAGGAYGAANAIERSSKLNIGQSAGSIGMLPGEGVGSGGSSGGFSSSGGWGTPVAPTTVNYSANFIVQGNGYFGSDADREIANRVIRLLEEARGLGHLN